MPTSRLLQASAEPGLGKSVEEKLGTSALVDPSDPCKHACKSCYSNGSHYSARAVCYAIAKVVSAPALHAVTEAAKR